MVRVAREGMGARASNVIFYLGESERRPPDFVFRKITRGLAAVKLGRAERLSLGDTTIVRDFCHARDLAAAAVKIALDGPANDYVCASGEAHAIQDVVTVAAETLGLDAERVVRTDECLRRTADIRSLVGDATRLRALGWRPSMGFRDLVRTLTEHDLAALHAEGTAP
jgi:GDPmannose 4,6-dehydratase